MVCLRRHLPTCTTKSTPASGHVFELEAAVRAAQGDGPGEYRVAAFLTGHTDRERGQLADGMRHVHDRVVERQLPAGSYTVPLTVVFLPLAQTGFGSGSTIKPSEPPAWARRPAEGLVGVASAAGRAVSQIDVHPRTGHRNEHGRHSQRESGAKIHRQCEAILPNRGASSTSNASWRRCILAPLCWWRCASYM